MTNSPTLKALASTVVTFAFILSVGALTNAVGQDTATAPASVAVNPYETVDSQERVATHNSRDQHAASATAHHNQP